MINQQHRGPPVPVHVQHDDASPAGSCSTASSRSTSQTGAEERYAFGDGVFGSETPMAPRAGATDEDDGYLVTFTTDMVRDCSECLVLDAKDIAAGPIARVRASRAHLERHPLLLGTGWPAEPSPCYTVTPADPRIVSANR